MDVLQTAGPAVLWLYGGWLVFQGQATVGTVVTFIVVLAGRLGGAIGQLGSLHVTSPGRWRCSTASSRCWTCQPRPPTTTAPGPLSERGARSASTTSPSPTAPGCGRRCRRSRSGSSQPAGRPGRPDRGRLVEQGTYPELLAAGGLYAELYQRQFQPQEPAVAQLSG
jgi:ABC-type multidrug transport system fused ATPase/permease subunit